jgi:hypothetical protein
MPSDGSLKAEGDGKQRRAHHHRLDVRPRNRGSIYVVVRLVRLGRLSRYTSTEPACQLLWELGIGAKEIKRDPSLALLQKVGPPVPKSHKNWGPCFTSPRNAVVLLFLDLFRGLKKQFRHPFAFI